MKGIISRLAYSIVAFAVVQGECAAQFDLVEQGQVSTSDGRQLYPLTAEPGPVMIKVASFIGSYKNPNGEVFANGLEIANALAKELREEHGIEAYTCSFQAGGGGERTPEQQEAFEKQLELFEEKFKVAPRVFKLRTPPPVNWVVLAGSFKSYEDKHAQRMLDKVRQINPRCISGDLRKQLRFGRSEGDVPNPLKTAMLVVSPHPNAPKLVTSAEEEQNRLFHMLLELNDGERYSVYQLNAPGTIQVAQYRGIAVVDEKKAKSLFANNKVKEDKAILQLSAQKAIVLTETLRKQGYEAYVFHGKFASIVTVGGYTGYDDPRLRADIEKLSQVTIAGLQLQPKFIPTPRRPPIDVNKQMAN